MSFIQADRAPAHAHSLAHAIDVSHDKHKDDDVEQQDAEDGCDECPARAIRNTQPAIGVCAIVIPTQACRYCHNDGRNLHNNTTHEHAMMHVSTVSRTQKAACPTEKSGMSLEDWDDKAN